MKEQVTLYLDSFITEPGEEEPYRIRQCVKASYSFRRDSHYLCYREPGKQETEYLVVLMADGVRIKKTGAVQTDMEIFRGRESDFLYQTPYGSIPAKLSCLSYDRKEGPEPGVFGAEAFYRLALGGGEPSDFHIRLTARHDEKLLNE